MVAAFNFCYYHTSIPVRDSPSATHAISEAVFSVSYFLAYAGPLVSRGAHLESEVCFCVAFSLGQDKTELTQNKQSSREHLCL